MLTVSNQMLAQRVQPAPLADLAGGVGYEYHRSCHGTVCLVQAGVRCGGTSGALERRLRMTNRWPTDLAGCRRCVGAGSRPDRNPHSDRTDLPPPPQARCPRPLDPPRVQDHHDHARRSRSLTQPVTGRAAVRFRVWSLGYRRRSVSEVVAFDYLIVPRRRRVSLEFWLG